MIYNAYVVKLPPDNSEVYKYRVKVRCPAIHGLDPDAPKLKDFPDQSEDFTRREDLPWVRHCPSENFSVGDEVFLEVSDDHRVMLIDHLSRPVSETGLSDGGAIFKVED